VMNAGVFPSVAKIRFVRIIEDKTSFIDQTKTLGWLTVMFMYFGYAVWEIKLLMVDRMIKRYFNQFKFRKNFLEFNTSSFIQDRVVIDMQEAGSEQILSHVFSFRL